MGTVYYKPDDARNPDGIEVKDSWTDKVKSIYRTMLETQGYVPLSEKGENIQSAFEISTPEIKAVRAADGKESYVRIWNTRRIIVHISMEAALRFLESKNRLDDFITKVYSDSALTDWWLNRRTYIRGDRAHKAICERLGFTEDFMEKMALECREII